MFGRRRVYRLMRPLCRWQLPGWQLRSPVTAPLLRMPCCKHVTTSSTSSTSITASIAFTCDLQLLCDTNSDLGWLHSVGNCVNTLVTLHPPMRLATCTQATHERIIESLFPLAVAWMQSSGSCEFLCVLLRNLTPVLCSSDKRKGHFRLSRSKLVLSTFKKVCFYSNLVVQCHFCGTVCRVCLQQCSMLHSFCIRCSLMQCSDHATLW